MSDYTLSYTGEEVNEILSAAQTGHFENVAVDGSLTVGGDIHLDNVNGLYIKNSNGEPRQTVYIEEDNDVYFGYGSYSASEGSTFFVGNNIGVQSNTYIYMHAPSAGLNHRAYGVNKVLVSTAYYMNGSQSVTLSEAVSAQPNGIVLVFSSYSNGAADDAQFHSFFVPKALVAAHPGKGSEFIMVSSNTPATFRFKYLYISDTVITGHADNTKNATSSSGVKIANDGAVLRYVIGV